MRDDLRHRMAQKHEADLVDLLGGRLTRGSGNQPANPLDGRQSHHIETYAFAWDAKSTLRRSISVSRATWDKVVDQAHGERPLLPLRFYDTERLHVGLDLVTLGLHDFAELLWAAEGGEG